MSYYVKYGFWLLARGWRWLWSNEHHGDPPNIFWVGLIGGVLFMVGQITAWLWFNDIEFHGVKIGENTETRIKLNWHWYPGWAMLFGPGVTVLLAGLFIVGGMLYEYGDKKNAPKKPEPLPIPKNIPAEGALSTVETAGNLTLIPGGVRNDSNL